MDLKGIIITAILTFLGISGYGQKIDTTFYPNKSILLIQSSDSHTKTVLEFYDKEGKNIIGQQTFEYSFFDSTFNMKRVVKIADKRLFEDYWISNSDTVYNEFNFDLVLINRLGAEFIEYIQSILEYPQDATRGRIQGKVIIQFIVNKKGKITKPKALTDYGYGLEEEAIRVVERADEFGTITYNGRAVNFVFKLPINFKLRN